MFDCLLLDPFALFDDGLSPAEVGIGGGHIVQALVVALVIVVLNEGVDLGLKVSGQELALLWQILQNRLGDAFVTVRASPGRRSCEEVEDGLPDGGHARLRWWPCDSFFSVPLL